MFSCHGRDALRDRQQNDAPPAHQIQPAALSYTSLMPDRTRRQFLFDAAALLASIDRAAAIDADPGSTYLDAEHVVVLMQENRSFDHMYGALRGVRGFNDPRAVTLPDGRPVWLQTNTAGETWAPFRLNIRDTNITWLGSLPHSWRDQIDARNHGNHDRWLDAKPSGRKECAGMPITLGYYNRDDLPFYYALADAFTVCDQHFCSSLTGTTPNRHYLWTGTVRPAQNAQAPAYVRNGDTDHNSMVRWTTFPERLEDAGVSWKIYQNELSLPSGLTNDEDAWLSNFTDNSIEWFAQFRVQFSKTFRSWAAGAVTTLPAEVAALDRRLAEGGPDTARLNRERRSKARLLQLAQAAAEFTDDAWAKLSQRDRNLHEKAFCTNAGDPDYRQLATLSYRDGASDRTMTAPKGDVLRNFREDVQRGQLPAVSWLVPPENFSDHPGAPWYGSWMVSEVLRILTEKPEVWKKTIFILTYDENDGYFDHVPPFSPPDPARPETGRTTEGIDPALEYWPLERDLERASKTDARGGPIGLGYRVPLVIASPWSRGGAVCSQVFDHTSVLQLLESVLTRKLRKPVRETNISAWRRAVCGDLSSAFQPAAKSTGANPAFTQRNAELERIHKAQFRPPPAGFAKSHTARQEKGVRPSLPLPYELYAAGGLTPDRRSVRISMEAGDLVFGAKSAGSPFHVYSPGTYGQRADLRTRSYAVEPGKRLTDIWELEGFENGVYRLCVCGPNGFLREFAGSVEDPEIALRCEYRKSGDLAVILTNSAARAHNIRLVNHMYKGAGSATAVRPGEKKTVVLKLAASHSWYDFTLQVAGSETFARRCAGRVEIGKLGFTDPVMGGLA
jgi:phospholipase C